MSCIVHAGDGYERAEQPGVDVDGIGATGVEMQGEEAD